VIDRAEFTPGSPGSPTSL